MGIKGHLVRFDLTRNAFAFISEMSERGGERGGRERERGGTVHYIFPCPSLDRGAVITTREENVELTTFLVKGVRCRCAVSPKEILEILGLKSDVERTLDIASHWFIQNCLKINPTKTDLLIIK